VAADGTLYFGSGRPGGKGRTDLYRARFSNGAYQQPENLGTPINTEFQEYEPFTSPDQNFLIFMAARPGNQGDLYISYNRNGSWTEPKSLGEKINSPGTEYSPKMSPDGKYFFFSSTKATMGEQPFARRQSYKELIEKLRGPGNGLGDIYQMDLTAVGIEHAR
jgi:Tol biopolymer transport system component